MAADRSRHEPAAGWSPRNDAGLYLRYVSAQVRAQLLIVSCYLPAFLALVLAPLFISVLGGLGSR